MARFETKLDDAVVLTGEPVWFVDFEGDGLDMEQLPVSLQLQVEEVQDFDGHKACDHTAQQDM